MTSGSISGGQLTSLATLLSRGPSTSCLFRALVDSSISVESEPDDDPWDARDGDGDQSDKDEPSENSSALLPKKTHSLAL